MLSDTLLYLSSFIRDDAAIEAISKALCFRAQSKFSYAKIDRFVAGLPIPISPVAYQSRHDKMLNYRTMRVVAQSGKRGAGATKAVPFNLLTLFIYCNLHHLIRLPGAP